MKTRAAVAFDAGKPLEICEVDLEGPKKGEVLVELKATGVCHTDAFTLSGEDPEGAFPAILGHEGAGVVVEVGSGVKDLKAGCPTPFSLVCFPVFPAVSSFCGIFTLGAFGGGGGSCTDSNIRRGRD